MTNVGGGAIGIQFTGRSRAETKRKALAFWVENQPRLDLTMSEFLERCTITPDGTTIVFRVSKKRDRVRGWLERFGG